MQYFSIFSNLKSCNALGEFVRSSFVGAELIEEHAGRAKYLIPQAIPLATIFECIEDNKESLGILDYSVSQPTLEQIFVAVARKQEESTEPVEEQVAETKDNSGEV